LKTETTYSINRSMQVIPPDVSNSILAAGFADVMKSIVEGTGAAFLALGHPESGKTYTILGSLQPTTKQRRRGEPTPFKHVGPAGLEIA
jgi:hypothetical protein